MREGGTPYSDVLLFQGCLLGCLLHMGLVDRSIRFGFGSRLARFYWLRDCRSFCIGSSPLQVRTLISVNSLADVASRCE